jgi:hypothetical protein
LLAKQITSLTVDFSQSIDLYRYQYISYPELRLIIPILITMRSILGGKGGIYQRSIVC